MAGRRVESCVFFFLMIRGPPRSTLDRSSAASDVYKRREVDDGRRAAEGRGPCAVEEVVGRGEAADGHVQMLSLIHISEPTRPY